MSPRMDRPTPDMSAPVAGRPLLFEPIHLRRVTARNRIMLSPMCQYSARDGVPTEWHYIHLATRAVGGAGIVMTEATAIEPVGRISAWDTGLYSDEQEAAFARIAERVAEYGAVPGIQLGHAGRKASHTRPWEQRRPMRPEEGGWDVIGPSAVPWEPGDVVPKAMTADDIAAVVDKWRVAAERARRVRLRDPRDPRRTRVPPALLPLAALEQTNRSLRGRARGASSAARRGGRRRPHGLARRVAAVRAVVRHRLGRGWLGAR